MKIILYIILFIILFIIAAFTIGIGMQEYLKNIIALSHANVINGLVILRAIGVAVPPIVVTLVFFS
jgi:hypothetical protein